STIVSEAPAPWIVSSLRTSRSPVAEKFSPTPGIVSVYVPGPNTMTSAPGHDAAFACCTAARSVQHGAPLHSACPGATSQRPSATFASTASAVEFTINGGQGCVVVTELTSAAGGGPIDS